jgi:hypothetical protein
MTLDRAWLRVALIVALMVAIPGLVRAGGVGFGDDDDNDADEGPSYFGFVRERFRASVRISAPMTSASPAPRTATSKRACRAGRAITAIPKTRSRSSAI